MSLRPTPEKARVWEEIMAEREAKEREEMRLDERELVEKLIEACERLLPFMALVDTDSEGLGRCWDETVDFVEGVVAKARGEVGR